jgi:hypothetical protein
MGGQASRFYRYIEKIRIEKDRVHLTILFSEGCDPEQDRPAHSAATLFGIGENTAT